MSDPENITRLPGVVGELVPNPWRQPERSLPPRRSYKSGRLFAAALILFALIVFATELGKES